MTNNGEPMRFPADTLIKVPAVAWAKVNNTDVDQQRSYNITFGSQLVSRQQHVRYKPVVIGILGLPGNGNNASTHIL